jgi:hypothetical protein
MASQGYGSERYIYKDGIRHRVGFVRTIRPDVSPIETHAAFERRMDLMCRQLLAMQSVTDVRPTMERRDGAIVECIVDVTYTPTPEAIANDTRPAGGRADSRGVRGGRRSTD